MSPNQLFQLSPARRRAVDETVAHMLHTMRDILDMDVAFIAEFIGDRRIFRHVDSRARPAPIVEGDVVLLDDGYCQKVVDGRLPRLMPDTSLVPAAMEIPATREMPIGSHISVPLNLSDGTLYGTFCCYAFKAKPHLDDRDLKIVSAFASLVSRQIDTDIALMQQPSTPDEVE